MKYLDPIDRYVNAQINTTMYKCFFVATVYCQFEVYIHVMYINTYKFVFCSNCLDTTRSDAISCCVCRYYAFYILFQRNAICLTSCIVCNIFPLRKTKRKLARICLISIVRNGFYRAFESCFNFISQK